mmetsp:Transcript_6267/g.5938  ORF Transcript_6267/g.5938 Transcript_6267/m.5938 type:complete len:205 (-) Transcript_6267:8-622(-)
MVPVGIPASTLEDPSRGSNTTTYLSVSSTISSLAFPSLPLAMSTGSSSSSEARTPIFPEKRRARFKRSLVITSSFFWSSPCILTSPSSPRVSLDGSWDLLTRLVMALQAVSMAPKRVVNSESSGLSMATSAMKRVRVTPVVSHTSSKTGALVLVSTSAVEKRAEVREAVLAGEKAATEVAVKRNAMAENFMFLVLSKSTLEDED